MCQGVPGCASPVSSGEADRWSSAHRHLGASTWIAPPPNPKCRSASIEHGPAARRHRQEGQSGTERVSRAMEARRLGGEAPARRLRVGNRRRTALRSDWGGSRTWHAPGTAPTMGVCQGVPGCARAVRALLAREGRATIAERCNRLAARFHVDWSSDWSPAGRPGGRATVCLPKM